MTGQNDRQDRSLTGQVNDQAGHCPLTGRYLQPWTMRSHFEICARVRRLSFPRDLSAPMFQWN